MLEVPVLRPCARIHWEETSAVAKQLSPRYAEQLQLGLPGRREPQREMTRAEQVTRLYQLALMHRAEAMARWSADHAAPFSPRPRQVAVFSSPRAQSRSGKPTRAASARPASARGEGAWRLCGSSGAAATPPGSSGAGLRAARERAVSSAEHGARPPSSPAAFCQIPTRRQLPLSTAEVEWIYPTRTPTQQPQIRKAQIHLRVAELMHISTNEVALWDPVHVDGS
ncbi:hypothetical protein AB1Y20_005986 [Prymnesium parvum]|uniref:Uncharacterized protein n=1 Tax=Prymnesium parvum TaxID=97485 RepID=A0AB34J2T8_PRYPA